MNTIELTREVADTYDSKSLGKRKTLHSKIPAWFKTLIYIGLGALTYQGALITYEQTKKALIQAKYSYISGVIAEELDGKSFKLSTDIRDNKKHQFGDLTPAEMSMAIWALSGELSQCESLRSTVHDLTTGISVVTNGK